MLRVYIQLKHAQHWGYSLSYDSAGRKLVMRVRRQPPVLDIRKLRIAIDAGHGGDNAGASGVTSNILEKDYTAADRRTAPEDAEGGGCEECIYDPDDRILR